MSDCVGLVMWGKAMAGKSTLVNTWTNTPQPSSYDHHEPRKVEYELSMNKRSVKLRFFDVAAENIEDKSVTMETHNKSGPIQIFVMSNEEQNDDVGYCRGLYESPMWNAEEVKLTVIILNKTDLNGNDNEEQVQSFLEKYPKVMFFKTTIKDEEGIKNVLTQIMERYISENKVKLGKSKKKDKKEKDKKGGCKSQ
ncbi:Small GTPase [Entamoeba marina]